MHAWTDGYEISEVNNSKTKKKNRTGAGARTLDHKLSLRET